MPFPSPFHSFLHQLEHKIGLDYRMAVAYSTRSTVQLICDMLRSDKQLNVSEIARKV
jgi:hypothetical protein